MFTADQIKDSPVKMAKVLHLLVECTKADVAARTNRATTVQAGAFFQQKLDLEDRIRCLLFGTADLYELAALFGWKK